MNIAQWLKRTSVVHGAAPCLFHGQQLLFNYSEFEARVARFAGGLLDMGIVPGDRVAIAMANHPDYLTALFGAWYAGAVVVPVNAKLHANEIAWILADSGSALCLVTDVAHASRSIHAPSCRLAEVNAINGPPHEPEERAPTDLAWLFYTSGTTGRPKGVMITHRMLVTMSLSYLASVDDVSSQDATVYAAPMSHGAGLYALVHMLRGARHVVPPSGGFDPAELLALAAHHTHAHLFAAPTMIKRLTAYAQQTGSKGEGLRSVVYGGGPMYVADIEAALDQFGPVFIQIYGQGEAPMAITCLSRSDIRNARPDRLATVGCAQAGVDLKIADADGNPVPFGKTGEIMVAGDLVMPSYWQNPKATEETLRNGWLRTGDIGSLDSEGYLTMVDRSKDVIISGGSNIYPREVEEVLLTHPSVSEVAVIGRASEEWGEDVVACVVPRDRLDVDVLDAHCLASLARFKRPKAYFELKELPKNAYGKVLKTELRNKMG